MAFISTISVLASCFRMLAVILVSDVVVVVVVPTVTFCPQVYENGLDEGEFDYYFNLREATRGVTNENKEMLLQRVRACAFFCFVLTSHLVFL